MILGGHPLARSFRLVAWALMATCSFSALEPYIAWAQPAPPQPAPPPPAPMPPQPLPPPGPGGLPPGPEMTLDQAAPLVTPMPAPQGQGPIQRILVESALRYRPVLRRAHGLGWDDTDRACGRESDPQSSGV